MSKKIKRSKSHLKQNSVIKQTTFKFKSYQSIGAPDAETDNNLDKVFVDNGAFDALIDTESPKCIIVGRTGSGKSALIKRL